jgi:hypothetical protein
MARKMPNGTSFFFPMSERGTKMRLPISAPRKMVSSVPCQPRKAPTIAIILMSPPPIASCLNIHSPAMATSHSRPKPTAPPRSATPSACLPAASANRIPSASPPSENSSGMM